MEAPSNYHLPQTPPSTPAQSATAIPPPQSPENQRISAVAQQRMAPLSAPTGNSTTSLNDAQKQKMLQILNDYHLLRREVDRDIHLYYACFKIPKGMKHFFHFSMEDFFRIFFQVSFNYLMLYPDFQFLNHSPENEKYYSQFVKLLTSDLKDPNVRLELFNLLQAVYTLRANGLTPENKNQILPHLNHHATFLNRLLNLLKLSTTYRLPLCLPKEEPAKLPYHVLLKALEQVNTTLNSTLDHIGGLAEAIEEAHMEYRQRGIPVPPYKKKIANEIKFLIIEFRRLVNLHSLKLKSAQKQFHSFIDEDQSIAPLEKLKYFSFAASLILDPLGKKHADILERFQKLYYALNEGMPEHKEVAPTLFSISPIYLGFSEKLKEIAFSSPELKKETTIKPFLTILAMAADFIHNNWSFNKAKQKKIAQFGKQEGSAWHTLLQQFLAHLAQLKNQALDGLEGEAKKKATNDFSDCCTLALNKLRKMAPKELEVLFGKHPLNRPLNHPRPFSQVLFEQLLPGLAMAAKTMDAHLEGKASPEDEMTLETGMNVFKRCSNILTLSRFTYGKILQEINQKLQIEDSLQEMEKLKAEYFFHMENREFNKRSQKIKKEAKALASSELTEVAESPDSPHFPDFPDSPDAFLLAEMEKLSLAASPKARSLAKEVKKAKGPTAAKGGQKGLQQLFNQVNQRISLKALDSAQERDIFYQDALFHFNHFMRGWELLQLAKVHLARKEGFSFSPKAIVPHLVYHLGLANEQALSPLYIDQCPQENVSHNLVQMAAACQLSPDLVAPLNQASIAFRYPYAHQKRLQCLGKEIPLGLRLIVNQANQARSAENSYQQMEEVVKGGVSSFIASLSENKRLSGLKPWLNQAAIDPLLLPVEPSSPNLKQRKKELRQMVAYLELKLMPKEAALEALIQKKSESADFTNLLKTIRDHLKGLREMMALASLFPYQRFLSFFQTAALIRGQYTLENIAKAIAHLEGEEWYTHSLKEYSDAYDIKSALSADNQKLWALYDVRKSSDYPFWHRAQKGERSFKPIEKLCHAYQLSLAAVDGEEGFIPSKESSDCIEQGYQNLQLFSQQIAGLIEEVLQKKIFSKLC